MTVDANARRRRSRRRFEDVKTSEIAAAAALSDTWAEVAERLGVCRQAVRRFVRSRPQFQLGMPARRAWLAEIERLAALHMTQEEIGAALVACPKTIHRAMREHGIAHRSRGRTAEERIAAHREIARLRAARGVEDDAE